MIPAFDENGYLPAGIHPATLEEVKERFGVQSEVREVQLQSLGWLVDLARRAGALRLVIDGSFATEAPEPNDVDCALLFASDSILGAELEAEFGMGLPFVHLERLVEADFRLMTEQVFGSDRYGVPKGLVEIPL